MNLKAENYRLKRKIEDLLEEVRELQEIILSSKGDRSRDIVSDMIKLYHERETKAIDDLGDVLNPEIQIIIEKQNFQQLVREGSRKRKAGPANKQGCGL